MSDAMLPRELGAHVFINASTQELVGHTIYIVLDVMVYFMNKSLKHFEASPMRKQDTL